VLVKDVRPAIVEPVVEQRAGVVPQRDEPLAVLAVLQLRPRLGAVLDCEVLLVRVVVVDIECDHGSSSHHRPPEQREGHVAELGVVVLPEICENLLGGFRLESSVSDVFAGGEFGRDDLGVEVDGSPVLDLKPALRSER
jgi:hypothetical protein